MTRNAPLAEQAERLRTLGQDPVRWLATLAELEEKLLGWKRAHGIAELGPAEAVRAIREARVWCAPSVILLVGSLRTDIAKRKTDEDENPNPTRRVVNYGTDTDERALRRIADAIADPGSDVSPARAEEIRLNYLAFEIRRFVQRRKAEGASAREALTEAARRYHFGSRVKAGPIVHGRPTDSRSTPGWQAVERFLLRRRPKKSTDVSPRAPNVGAEIVDAAGTLAGPSQLSTAQQRKQQEEKRCRPSNVSSLPAKSPKGSASGSRPSASGGSRAKAPVTSDFQTRASATTPPISRSGSGPARPAAPPKRKPVGPRRRGSGTREKPPP